LDLWSDHNKLNSRRKDLPPPVYVSISSDDRYYLRFRDGSTYWCGCDDMTEALNKTPHRVTSVAFGGEWDSYFIVTQNGGYMYRNIPSALHDLIERRQQKTDIECLSLGPDGEYYLKAKNGRAWWGGVSTSTRLQSTKII